MIVVDCVQRSVAWRLARCGRLTGSRAHDILTRARGLEESLARQRYRRQLIVERLTGVPEDRAFVSAAMHHGRRQEPAAREVYACRTRQVVHTSGFVVHDELLAGSSLDGHVGDVVGVIEIKAPNTLTHLRYLATKRVPKRYLSQITHHLWVTGARWCDFVSYDDRLPERMQLLVVRLWREQLDIPAYDRLARRFLSEVDAQVDALASLRPVEFFRAAPLDVAQHVLAACVGAVDARRRAPRPAVVRSAWQPRLVRAS